MLLYDHHIWYSLQTVFSDPLTAMVPLSGIAAILFALWKSSWISKQNPGNEKMQEIGLAIREGATAFLKREYRVLAIFVLVVAGLLYWVNSCHSFFHCAL